MKTLIFSLFFIPFSYAGNLSVILGASGGGGKPTYVGNTTATYQGNLGGLTGANAKCHSEFPDSHFCSDTEYLQTGDRTAGVAWVNGKGYPALTANTGTFNCSNWTNNQSLNGRSGSTLGGISGCGVSRPIACCK